MKITIKQEDIDALLDAAKTQEHTFWGGKEMFVSYQLPSGFTVTGRAAMLDPRYFDAEIGRNICRENAAHQLWQLEGYRLQLELAKEGKIYSEGFQQSGGQHDQQED